MNFRNNKYLPSSIDIKINATHINYVNKNAVKYSIDAVKNGISSWVTPYQKPQLVGHDKQSDPIGRVVGCEYVHTDSLSEPPDFVQLTARITDAAAIEKVMDGRYNTVSVGSKSSKVICSECHQNIIEDGLCEHKKGTTNRKGNRIHWLIDQIEYIECSFVNEPADEYACIDQINIGNGFVPYKEFLDNRETLISELLMEDEQMLIANAQLSSAQRKNLPDSAFAYVSGSGDDKVRKFPAHDAAHVRNGLAKLSDAELPAEAKSKVLACLKRRAKRFGIDIKNDDSFSQEAIALIDSIDPALGLNDTWTEDEVKAIEQLFINDPKFDELPEENADSTETQDDNQSADKMKKDELVVAYKKLQEDSKRAIEARDSKISKLETKVSELETILIEREDEVNNYLDQTAGLEQRLRDSIINNIIDLKKPDNKEEGESLKTKLQSRTLESLIDSLSDLRTIENKSDDSQESEDRVTDPTTQNQENNDSADEDEKTKDPWTVFSKDNRTVEVE